MSTDKTIQVATEIEGHPDNIVPAIVGGMVISLQEGEKISYSKVQFPHKLNCSNDTKLSSKYGYIKRDASKKAT